MQVKNHAVVRKQLKVLSFEWLKASCVAGYVVSDWPYLLDPAQVIEDWVLAHEEERWVKAKHLAEI